MSNIDELAERAEKARGKKAAFGPDIPLESYTSNAPAHKKILTLKTLPSNYQSQSLGVGIDAKEDERSGSYFLEDLGTGRRSAQCDRSVREV
jgi:hypothetical protein